MKELNEAFNGYLNVFKTLETDEKRNEILTSIKEIIVIFEQLAKIDNIELEYLQNNEIIDIKSKDFTEDDFLEAELVYIETAKNIIGQYLEKKGV